MPILRRQRSSPSGPCYDAAVRCQRSSWLRRIASNAYMWSTQYSNRRLLAALYPFTSFTTRRWTRHDDLFRDALGLSAASGEEPPIFFGWLVAGAVLGISVLIRATMLTVALAAAPWIAVFDEGAGKKQLRASIVSSRSSLPLGPGSNGNPRLSAVRSLTSEAGYQFWMAHNPQTTAAIRWNASTGVRT